MQIDQQIARIVQGVPTQPSYIPQMLTFYHIHFIVLCVSIFFLKHLRISCRHTAPFTHKHLSVYFLKARAQRVFRLSRLSPMMSFMTKENPRSHGALRYRVLLVLFSLEKLSCLALSFIALTFWRNRLFCRMFLSLGTSDAFLMINFGFPARIHWK